MQLMTRTKLSFSGLFSRVLTYITLASVISLTLHPWQAGFTKPVTPSEKRLSRANESQVNTEEQEPDLSDKWNEDIYAPNSPASASITIQQPTSPKPSIHMERPVLRPAPQSAPVAVKPVIMPGQLDNPAYLQKQYRAQKAAPTPEEPTRTEPVKAAKQPSPQKQDQKKPNRTTEQAAAPKNQPAASAPEKHSLKKKEIAEKPLPEQKALPANQLPATSTLKTESKKAKPVAEMPQNALEASKPERPKREPAKLEAAKPDKPDTRKQEKTAKIAPEKRTAPASQVTTLLPEPDLEKDRKREKALTEKALKKEKRKKDKLAKAKPAKPVAQPAQPKTAVAEPLPTPQPEKQPEPAKTSQAKPTKPHKEKKHRLAKAPKPDRPVASQGLPNPVAKSPVEPTEAEQIQAEKKRNEQVAKAPEPRRLEKPKKAKKLKVAQIKDKPFRLPDSPVIVALPTGAAGTSKPVSKPTEIPAPDSSDQKPPKTKLTPAQPEEKKSEPAFIAEQPKPAKEKRKPKTKRQKHETVPESQNASAQASHPKEQTKTEQSKAEVAAVPADLNVLKDENKSRPKKEKRQKPKQSKPVETLAAARQLEAKNPLESAQRTESRKKSKKRETAHAKHPEMSKPNQSKRADTIQTPAVSTPVAADISGTPVESTGKLASETSQVTQKPKHQPEKSTRKVRKLKKHGQKTELAQSPLPVKQPVSTETGPIAPIVPEQQTPIQKERAEKSKKRNKHQQKSTETALLKPAHKTAAKAESDKKTAVDSPEALAPVNVTASQPSEGLASPEARPIEPSKQAKDASALVKPKKLKPKKPNPKKSAESKTLAEGLNPFPSATAQASTKPPGESQVFGATDSEKLPVDKAAKKRKPKRHTDATTGKPIEAKPQQAEIPPSGTPELAQADSKTKRADLKPAKERKSKRSKVQKEKTEPAKENVLTNNPVALGAAPARLPQGKPRKDMRKKDKSKRAANAKPSTESIQSIPADSPKAETTHSVNSSPSATQKPGKAKTRRPESTAAQQKTEQKQASQLQDKQQEKQQTKVEKSIEPAPTVKAASLEPTMTPNPAIVAMAPDLSPQPAKQEVNNQPAPTSAESVPTTPSQATPLAQTEQPQAVQNKANPAQPAAESVTVAAHQQETAQTEAANSVNVAQQKAAEYHALLTQRLQSGKTGSFEPILQKGQEAATEILRSIDMMDDATYQAVSGHMQGYLLMRDEIVVAAPDTVFFLNESKKHGTPTDVAFFTLMSKTLNGYWPVTMEQLTDLSGCTRFGTHDLITLYGEWKEFRKKHPTAYQSAFVDPNLLLLTDIEDQLLNSQAACEGPETVIEELSLFVKLYPKSELTPKLKLRLDALQKKPSDMVYYQGVKHSLNK